jgi:PAS domain S-box-containing protein
MSEIKNLSAAGTLEESPSPVQRIAELEQLFSQAPGMLVILKGPEHVIELANRAYLELIGGRQILHLPLRQAIPELEGQGYFELLDNVYSSGEPFIGKGLPVAVRRGQEAKVEKRFFDFVYQPIKDAAGQVTGIFANGYDVTDAKLAQDQLHRSEETLRVAMSAARLGSWERDLITGELVASDGCKANLGLPADDVLSFEQLQSMRHPDDVGRVNQSIREAIEQNRDYDVEYRSIWPDGSVHWILARGHALYDENAKPTRMVGVTLDITARKQAEDAVRKSGALQKAVLESALDCIIAVDHHSRVIEWNPAAERTFGYLRSDALGRDLAELIIPPELREAHRLGMNRFLATGHGPVLGRRIEVEAINAEGRRFPIELAIEATEISGMPRFVAYLRDLTRRKAAEAALLESEQRLNATYEHAFVGISEVDLSGRFSRVNEELCRISGFRREELLSRTFLDITHPDDRDEDLENFQRQLAGTLDSYTLEKRYIRKDGTEICVELSGSMVRDTANRPLYAVRVVRDITERITAERHQALLVNELNHRVKNTLATVQSIVAQTLRTYTDPLQASKEVGQRLVALSRAHDVLTRANWESASLREIVAEALEPYADFHTRFTVDGPEIQLSPRVCLSLAMAIQELTTNAIKYGALSAASGQVRVIWSIAETSQLHFCWKENGGPSVSPPTRRGFGTRLLEAGLARDMNGTAKVTFAAEGLECTFKIPLGGSTAALAAPN